MDLYDLTIAEASARLARRELSAVELTQAHLDRIATVDGHVRAFVTVTPEVALEAAAAADRRLAVGERGPLLGVPMALKDVISTRGIRTTCSSKMLEHFIPIYDATVVTKLYAAGAVLLGKTNMDEFAMGSSCENSAFFPTHNPWDLDRVPGGSSGGSAAAVAAGEAIYTLGSDTGGSIRQPASLCGVVGLKPTYGRVSRFGLVAFASSLDQIGPFTRTVEDAAIVLEAIAGRDPNDSTSADVPVPNFRAALGGDLRGLRLGVPKEYFVRGMQPGVDAALRAAIRELEALGATVDWDVSLPHTEYALAVYYLVAPSEASANLARYDGVKYGFSAEAPTMWEEMERTRGLGFGPEVKRRIMLGTYALSAGYYDAYYLKAQKVRTLIKRDFDEAFARYDALVAPTSPTVAFRLGEKLDDPLQMYLSDVCTLPINIAGVCGLSVPAGLSDGLPVGLQIIGKPFDEATILRIGHAYQQATHWHTLRPALARA
ncbi:MAG: glutamyl-tRNA(Gln) amidotransferase subunit A [Dehalococcoidia bacterium]|nr:MAG: glutamyl-tRNA(Gln) amidotransferase subunit A [Dehalococcoidia bacterium]